MLGKKLKIYYHKVYFIQKRFFKSIRFQKDIRKNIKSILLVKEKKRDTIYLNDCKVFLRNNFSGFKNTDWHHYYSNCSGKKHIHFIPDILFFNRIEPTLNHSNLMAAYTDKNFTDIFLPDASVPNTIFKIIKGNFYNSKNLYIDRTKALIQLRATDKTLVLKPAINSGAGKGIVIENSSFIADKLEYKPEYSKGSFVLQSRIEQHPEIEKFHPASLNTCRVMTARVNNEIVILSAYLRMGRNNNLIDNAQAGGLFSSINDNGQIADYAINKKLEKFDVHPNSNQLFSGFTIPNYQSVKEFCFENHMKFPHFTFISWDIAIGKDGTPIFIEYNLQKQAIHGHQVLNGPLFGEYTDYFMKKYNDEKSKISLLEMIRS